MLFPQVQEEFAFGISAELTRLRTAEKVRVVSRHALVPLLVRKAVAFF